MSEQLMQYENLGFVHLPRVIPPDLVARMRTAFNKAAAAHQPIWERAVKEEGANPAYFDQRLDLSGIVNAHDTFRSVGKRFLKRVLMGSSVTKVK